MQKIQKRKYIRTNQKTNWIRNIAKQHVKIGTCKGPPKENPLVPTAEQTTKTK